MKKEKVISFYINTLAASGGTQRMLSVLANILIESNEVVIFVSNDSPSFYKLNSGIVIIPIQKGILKTSLVLRENILKLNVDYLICLDSNTVILQTILLPFKVRLIIWEHFSLENNYKKMLFTISRFYASWRAHKVIVLSKIEKELWHQKYLVPFKKLEVIYNPFTLGSMARNIQNSYNNETVLAIGNHIEVKGFDLLLKAWKIIDTHCQLKIVGLKEEGIQQLNQLKKQHELKNVEILPKTNEILKYYQQASLFVLSSRKEATPLVLIEAQTFGIPVIAFDHLSSVKEMAGDSILYAKFEDKENGLATQLKALLENETLYESFHQKSLNNLAKFGLDNFTKKWETVFTS